MEHILDNITSPDTELKAEVNTCRSSHSSTLVKVSTYLSTVVARLYMKKILYKATSESVEYMPVATVTASVENMDASTAKDKAEDLYGEVEKA